MKEQDLLQICVGLDRIADAISPFTAVPGQDAAGGHVGCLTEAIMGNTAGLVAIAEAINNLADAVRDSRE